jgi:hypothetical protein
MKNIPVRSLKRVWELGKVPSCLLGAEGRGAPSPHHRLSLAVVSWRSGVRGEKECSIVHNESSRTDIKSVPLGLDSPIFHWCGEPDDSFCLRVKRLNYVSLLEEKGRHHQWTGCVFGDTSVLTVKHHQPSSVDQCVFHLEIHIGKNNTNTDIIIHHCKRMMRLSPHAKPCSVFIIAMSYLILSRDNNNYLTANPQRK